MNNKVFEYSYEMKKERNSNVSSIVLFCIFLFVFVNLILSYLIFPVRQQSISMTPDISENSLIMFTPLSDNYSRGDVILVKEKAEIQQGKMKCFGELLLRFFTAQQLSLNEIKNYPGTKQQIRRIVAVPGDSFYIRDHVMYIKPEGENHFLTEFEICKKPYNVSFVMPSSGWDNAVGVKGDCDEITLGEGEYFVLADYRLSSDDSRMYGSIKKSDIKGKALFCYFPLASMSLF